MEVSKVQNSVRSNGPMSFIEWRAIGRICYLDRSQMMTLAQLCCGLKIEQSVLDAI